METYHYTKIAVNCSVLIPDTTILAIYINYANKVSSEGVEERDEKPRPLTKVQFTLIRGRGFTKKYFSNIGAAEAVPLVKLLSMILAIGERIPEIKRNLR